MYLRPMRPDTKVFGIGLSKTGTLSLAKALTRLGIKTKHFPDDEATQEELRWGRYELSIFREYQGLVDIPVAPFYAQFDRIYPSAKFVLTTRPTDAWLVSLERHFQFWIEPRRTSYDDFVLACTYGLQHFSAERLRYAKEQHEAGVRRHFAGRPEKLLVLNVFEGDGWKELGAFLGCPVPDEPYPRENPARTGPAPASAHPGVVRALLRRLRRSIARR
jgi:Sulfotransferase domain